MGFSMQAYWSGLPFPSLGGLPDPGSNLGLLQCRQILYCWATWEALREVLWAQIPGPLLEPRVQLLSTSVLSAVDTVVSMSNTRP